MSEDLTPLPCPFCGHVGLDFKEGTTFRWLAYSCGGCGVESETRIQTLGEGTQDGWRAQAERDAIEEWNKRAPPREAAQPATPPEGQVWVRESDGALVMRPETFVVPAAEREAIREALVDATVHLIAAVSLLECGGKKAAASDKMFAQMLVDYNASIDRARTALAQLA